MPDTLKQQNEAITQERFDRLPALLTAYQVKLITGWNDNELYAEVIARRLKYYQRTTREGHKRSYRKYTKASLARLIGFKL